MHYRAGALILLLLFPVSITWGQDTILVRHYQTHSRYEFGLKLLDLALRKNDAPYRIIAPQKERINEARGHAMVVSGDLDIEFLMTSENLESSTIPVRFPVYRGILGLRLLLVRTEDQEKFSRLQSVADLRQYTAGHGLHWNDLPVFAANNLSVETSTSYESLFTQLKNHRFDYFHRGINEIWAEVAVHRDTLTIADNIMLFYPHPVYFFVSKSRPELAEQIERGLNRALADGSYKQLFLQHHQAFIDQANFASRRLLILTNPLHGDDAVPIDTSWWLPADLKRLRDQGSNAVPIHRVRDSASRQPLR